MRTFKSQTVEEAVTEIRKHRAVCFASDGMERMSNRDAFRCGCGDEFWMPPSYPLGDPRLEAL